MNSLYPLWKQSMMSEADINNGLDQTGTNAPYAALVNVLPSGYVYSAAHQFYSSVVAYVQGTPQPITSPTVTGSVFNGASVTFVNVTGAEVDAIVIFRQNAGANSTWRLVAYLDTAIASFPITPNGATLTINWNTLGILKVGSS